MRPGLPAAPATTTRTLFLRRENTSPARIQLEACRSIQHPGRETTTPDRVTTPLDNVTKSRDDGAMSPDSGTTRREKLASSGAVVTTSRENGATWSESVTKSPSAGTTSGDNGTTWSEHGVKPVELGATRSCPEQAGATTELLQQEIVAWGAAAQPRHDQCQLEIHDCRCRVKLRRLYPAFLDWRTTRRCRRRSAVAALASMAGSGGRRRQLALQPGLPR